jgi:hypothetical protein
MGLSACQHGCQQQPRWNPRPTAPQPFRMCAPLRHLLLMLLILFRSSFLGLVFLFLTASFCAIVRFSFILLLFPAFFSLGLSFFFTCYLSLLPCLLAFLSSLVSSPFARASSTSMPSPSYPLHVLITLTFAFSVDFPCPPPADSLLPCCAVLDDTEGTRKARRKPKRNESSHDGGNKGMWA